MRPSCSNCKYKIEFVTAAHVFVDITEPYCKKFAKKSFDKITGEKITPIPCEKAMEYFCDLKKWEPTLWYRIKRIFLGERKI